MAAGSEKPEVYSLEYIEDFFRAEYDADGSGSFAAVERSMSDRLLGSGIYTEGGGLVARLLRNVRKKIV